LLLYRPAWSSQQSIHYIQGFGLTALLIFGLLSVLDLIFSQVKLSDALSFAIDKELPLSQNEKTFYRSIDYYTNLSNQKFLS
jgi:hypothetical protein